MPRPKNTQLRETLATLHSTGSTVPEMCDATGISSTYVYQLLRELKLDPPIGKGKGNYTGERKLDDDQLQELVRRYRLGETQSEIARDLGLTCTRQAVSTRLNKLHDWDEINRDHKIARGRAALKRDHEAREKRKNEIRDRTRSLVESVPENTKKTNRYSDETLFEHLREWKRRHGLPVSIYRHTKTVHDTELASAPIYIHRFGSWNEAKRLAGIESQEAHSSRVYVRRWSNDDMLGYVSSFVETCLERGVTPSFGRFEKWLDSVGDDMPSGSLVRTRLSKTSARWLEVVAEAQRWALERKK